jgi:uncharacterized protein with ATP-grasp and redox domains
LKVGSRCGFCLLHRGYNIILRSTDDEEKRMEAVVEVIRMMGERFEPGDVPSHVGVERDRIIMRVTGCLDPYAELKRRANLTALGLLPMLEGVVEASSDRLKTACLISCLGNVIEYDVPGHSSDIDEALEGLGDGFCIDDVDGFSDLISPGCSVLFLTDNAGEIAFDRLVVRELRGMGCHVTVGVKGGPSLNDALMVDAVEVGMVDEADEVITTGTNAIGVIPEMCSKEFLERFHDVNLIVSKGMANWETLTEERAPCPTLYLFRTKCEPVARSVGVPMDKCVAKLVPEGWRL